MVFTLETEVVAVEGNTAVVRVRHGDPVQREYHVSLVQFDDDGRCISFEEWPFLPVKA